MLNRLLGILALFLLLSRSLGAAPTLDAAGAKALSGFLADVVRRGDVPGVVVMVVSPNGTLYHEAFGKLDVAKNVDMQRDTIFRIASMTKAITSAAVMMLVEDGRVNLDDPIAKHLPAWKNPRVLSRVDLAAGTYETRPASRPITVRQLLTHTSGIGYAWSDPGLALVEKATGTSGERDLPLVNEPGAQWTYGASTKVLGDLIEKVSGQRLDAFLAERLFRPLGMQATGWNVPDDQRSRVVTLHRRTGARLVEEPNPAVLSGEPRGDGRLFSTAADYSRFVQMILNRGRVGTTRLLKSETVDEMGRNQTGDVTVRLQPVANPDYSKPYPLGQAKTFGGSDSRSRRHLRRWPTCAARAA